MFISGSGHIEFEEFVTVFTSCFQPPSEHELLEAFHAFDRDGDGFLTEEEVKGVLKNAKQPATNRNVSEMIKSVDTNGDGKINYKGNKLRTLLHSCSHCIHHYGKFAEKNNATECIFD